MKWSIDRELVSQFTGDSNLDRRVAGQEPERSRLNSGIALAIFGYSLELPIQSCHYGTSVVVRGISNSRYLSRDALHMRLARNQAIGHLVLACLFLLGSAAAVAGPIFPTDDQPTIVLKNATVHSLGVEGTFVGTVVVTDGKITAVGSDVEVPDDAKVFDLTGCHVVPGLIESRGKLWLTPAALVETNTKAELDVIDAIDPWSEDWKELAAQGITSVYAQQSSTSSLGGYGSVLRVGPYDSPDEIVLKKEVAVQASIGTRGSTSKDRYAQVLALEKLLENAKEKKSKDDDADDKKSKDDSEKSDSDSDSDSESEKDGESDEGDAPKKDSDDDSSKKDEKESTDEDDKPVDPTKVVLRRVLSRELPLFVELHHSDSLQHVLKLAKKFEIRIVIDGLSQTEGKTRELLDQDFPVVVGPVHEPAAAPDYRKHAKFDWLAELSDSGKLWAISGFSKSARGSRLLRVQAAKAVSLGADEDAVLAASTLNAARILGVSDQVGSLEVGKVADIAVFCGKPLDPSVPTRLVISRGKVIFDNPAEVVSAEPSSSQTGKPTEQPVAKLPTRLPNAYALKTTRLLRDGQLVEGVLTIKDGTIQAVGEPASGSKLPIYDLGDAVVSPGLVMASSTLGQEKTIVDESESDASHLRSVDAIDPDNKLSQRALAGGFLHVGVSPGASNTSAGVAGHVKLGAVDYVADPAIASQFVLSDSARKDDRFPSSLNGQVQLLNDLFAGKPTPSAVYVTTAIGKMIDREKLANVKSVLDRSRTAIIFADSKLEIRSAIALVKKHGIQAALLSQGRVGDFASQLAEHEIGLIVSSFSGDEYDSQIEQILQAQEAGAALAFAGDSPEKIRITAALLVNAGLAPEQALSALTESGGQLVGMKDIGLTQGAPADFVVWSDSPLNLAAKPLAVVVDGQSVTKK